MWGRPWTRCRCLGVKGRRVQVSPARQVNVGLSHLIRAAFIRPRPDIEHGLVIRVEITARHRRVLMASHTLEKCSSTPASATQVSAV